ncbi:MAG: energy-coupling factor ABC transporter ATP-binding protein [Anaerolineae bacterium]|nr:energy-coupling factor ABC transporter ATP-binding protein [Anaerolineae bacterium]MDW8070923.1 ABC transporter ATP-binding protein [Anaerolineae bacterium]
MKTLFEFENVCYRYPGHKQLALRNVNVCFPEGEKIAVVGRNGAGKSTLFLHCNGLYRPLCGRVSFRGRPLAYDRASLKKLRQQVGMIFQNPDSQLFSASVAQDISFGPLNLGLSEAEARRRVLEAAEICEITHLLDRPTHSLSGGEKTRVALAGVLAMQPEVLVADEPLASLDPWMRLTFFDILQRFYDRGKTILMATHNLSVVRYWASYVIVLQEGQVVFSGTPKALLTNRTVLEQTELSRVWWKVDPGFDEDEEERVLVSTPSSAESTDGEGKSFQFSADGDWSI